MLDISCQAEILRRWLRRFLILHIGYVAVFCALGVCNAFAASPGPYDCYHGYDPRAAPGDAFPIRGGGTLQVNGFTIEVKPVTNPTYPPGKECHATIRSPKGTDIFDVQDYGMSVDPLTGKDVNGDGQPDAVLEGFSGGAHCCTTYHVISLGKNPGLIRKLKNNASFKDLRGDGRIEIVIADDAFDYFYGDHAESPFPTLILRLEGRKFKDISSEFVSRYDEDIKKWRSELANFDVNGFHRNDVSMSGSDRHNIQYRVFSIILAYVCSARPKDARKTLDEFWPTDWPSPDFTRPISAEEIWNAMLKIYCAELPADLNRSSTPACKGGP